MALDAMGYVDSTGALWLTGRLAEHQGWRGFFGTSRRYRGSRLGFLLHTGTAARLATVLAASAVSL